MKFGQQKFLIGVLFCLLPLLGVFSLLESKPISNSLLKISLRFLNIKTGIPVTAKAWSLNPTTFSASLMEVEFPHSGIFFKVNELKVQISPVELIVGKVRFRSLQVNNLNMSGSAPKSWFEQRSDEPTPKIEEMPQLMSKAIFEFNQMLLAKNMILGELEINQASADLSNLKFSNLNFIFVNQIRSQAKIDLSFDDVEVPKKLSKTPSLKASISLMNTVGDKSAFLIKKLVIGGFQDSNVILSLSGRLPGRVSTRLRLGLSEVNRFLSSGEWTKEFAQQKLLGDVTATVGAEINKSNQWNVFVDEAKIENLNYEGYKISLLDLAIDFDSANKIDIKKADVVLPRSISEPKSWKHKLSISKFDIKEKGLVTGELMFKEVGLCSVMIASAIDECFSTFNINGALGFSGSLSPLKMTLDTNWDLSEATIFTEPEVPGLAAKDPLLNARSSKFIAKITLHDKYLEVDSAKLKWSGSELGLKGQVRYLPTKVDLDLFGDRVELSEVLSDFMNQSLSGLTNIRTQIFYDFSLKTRPERTKIIGNLEVDKLVYADFPIGEFRSPILYQNSDLNIGPASLVSGGGTAILRGVLQNRPGGKSRLEASATLRRYEVNVENQTKENIVSGYYTGLVKVDGYLSETATQKGIVGRISGQLDSSEVLGISLSKIEGQMSLKGQDLHLDSLSGLKNKKTIFANGVISPETGKSFVNFEAKDLDVVGLGWDSQIESLFKSGRVSLKGRWSDSEGYRLSGQLLGMADHSYRYGNGEFNASGNETISRFDVRLEDKFYFLANGRYKNDKLYFDEINANVKDQGIFLALSYLNEWKEKPDIQTLGSIKISSRHAEGSIEFGDALVRRRDSLGRYTNVFNVKSNKMISWNGDHFKTDAIGILGDKTDLKVQVLNKSLVIDGHWGSDLMDVFLPDFIRLKDGGAFGEIRLSAPLSLDSLKGSLKLSGVSLGVKGLGRYGVNTSGDVEIRDSRAVFKNIKSNFGSGVVEVSGEYKIDSHSPGVYLNANLKAAEFVFIDEVPAVTNGQVVMSGSSYPFDVRGRVQIVDGLYAAESSVSPANVSEDAEPVLKFDLALDVGSKFAVRNSLISTNASGAMRLTGTDINPSFIGVMQLENGRVFARDNEFKIIRGIVDFPENSKKVFINVTANSQIKATSQNYTITLNATGSTDEPNIEFQSNPPLSLPDIASLLAFGIVRSEESFDNSASLADTARAEALQTIFGKTVGSTLRKKAGLDVRVSARAALDQEQTIPKVTVVRKLSKKVTATFGRSLDFSRPENNVQVDYELLKNVNVSGVWENPNPKESSVGVDLRFKWDVQ